MTAPAYAYTHSFGQAHSITFLSDNLRNTLREVIRENGLNPEKLTQDWGAIENGIQTWLKSRHLTTIVVEFYRPGSSYASARWEFPIEYSGSGVDDDMWLDKSYLRQLIAKSAGPSIDCTYRILLCTKPGASSVSGLDDCNFLSTGLMSARQAGTVIATPHMTAGVTYWK